MATNTLYLGTHPDHGKLFLSKHSWDCNWYWAFGYIGNKNLHTHFDSTFLQSSDVASKIFTDTPYGDTEWWIVRDLFIQAYALKKAAEVYRIGGHQTTVAGLTDIIINVDMATRLNGDLECVLNTVWDLCSRISNRQPK